MLSGLITAIRTLTIFPLVGKEPKPFYYSLVWFPFVGLFIFLILTLFIQGLHSIASPQLTAFFTVALLAVITRGLHLDGVSDLADGFFGAYEKAKILLIMKDSCIGTFGGVALIFVLLGKILFLSELITHLIAFEATILPGLLACLLLVGLLSRGGMSLLAGAFSYAREDGTAKHFIAQAGKKEYLIAAFWMFGLSFLFVGYVGVVICLLYIFATHLFGFWSTTKIGGITGDVLGAWAEISELLLLLVLGIFPLSITVGFPVGPLLEWLR